MSAIVDMTGRRVGRLMVVRLATDRLSREAHWVCRCDCGELAVIRGASLRRKVKRTMSCGCARAVPARRNLARANAALGLRLGGGA